MVAVNTLLAGFGPKRVKMKSYLSAMETQAGNSTPALRNEALNFYKECFRWLKDGVKQFIEPLKKQQQDELEKAFGEIAE